MCGRVFFIPADKAADFKPPAPTVLPQQETFPRTAMKLSSLSAESVGRSHDIGSGKIPLA